MKENKTQVGLSARIPRETYDSMRSLLEVTGKSVAVFTADAIEQYIRSITTPDGELTNALKIDRFAWSLKQDKKKGNNKQ